MRTNITLFAAVLMFFCLSLQAQMTTNVPGVTLSGPVTDPTLVNHSGKMVVAAMVSLMGADGAPWVDLHIFATNLVTGVPDGGSAKAGGRGKHQKFDSPIVSAKVHAVIFADGEFRGTDSYEAGSGESAQANFQARVESSLQSMRQVWQMAKAGDWTAVKTLADKPLPGPNDNIYSWSLAQHMVALQAAEGSDKAVASTEFFGNLAASTWKSGALLNKLQFPDWFRSIGEWMMPTAYAQGLPFTNVLPWPQGSGTDNWHPNQWTYTCTTFVGYNNPCQPLRGETVVFRGETGSNRLIRGFPCR